MKSISFGLATAVLCVGMAAAQPAAQSSTMPRTSAGTPMSGPASDGAAAASGNDNQAVATTSANAFAPARGRNSFTQGEARRRLQARGYSNVASLRKDNAGVWRGQASKDGAQVGVWLDYKGNVGTGQP